MRPPSLNSPSPVSLAMRRSKPSVLLPTDAPPGFPSARFHGSRGEDQVNDIGSDKDDDGGDQDSHISPPSFPVAPASSPVPGTVLLAEPPHVTRSPIGPSKDKEANSLSGSLGVVSYSQSSGSPPSLALGSPAMLTATSTPPELGLTMACASTHVVRPKGDTRRHPKPSPTPASRRSERLSRSRSSVEARVPSILEKAAMRAAARNLDPDTSPSLNQVPQDDVAIAPDLAYVDLSAGGLPRPSNELLFPAQPSYKLKNAVRADSKVSTSTSHNSQATEQTVSKGKGQPDTDVVTLKATEEVITVEDVEERVQMDVDPASPRRSPVAMDTDHGMVPKLPEILSDASVVASTDIVQDSLSALVVSAPRPATPPTISYVQYPLARTLEDEVSASKEAVIQAELVNSTMRDAFNSSEVLKAQMRKYYELASKHLAMQEEVESLRAELEKEKKKNEKLEKEKAIMGGTLFIPDTTTARHNNQECQNKYFQESKGGEANTSFQDHLPPPNISNHSTYNVKDKTNKGMLDDEIFELYMEDLWTGIDPEKKSNYVYLDSLWFDMYINGKHKSKVLKWVKAKKIFTRRYVFVPIVYWGHWSLLVLYNFGETNYLGTPKGPRMLLLDSLRTTQPKSLLSAINSFMIDILKTEDREEETGQFINDVELEFPEVPQQSANDCGIYVLYFIYCFLKIEKLGEDLSQLGAFFDPEVLQNLEHIRKAILSYQEKQNATITE
uniref:Ubiquitin-like protease family profile domain-containing protein n=2 Tax=Hordeum vulgare subsp. vulgare TaxID=112509 RepID=A0A8I6XUL1_HORVV